ncbi:MAG: LVIVD repeat-containing protein [Propylenella sp.]
MNMAKDGGASIQNFRLLAQDELQGFGGLGEGMAIQIAEDGRRILWLAHEFAPKNFTGVDVSDPRKPKVVVQTSLPEPYMRSNSLELTGDIMAVTYQCKEQGQKPAGLELFDISVPEKPRSISFLDCSGPHSRGVHQLWFCDGEYVHMSSGAADFRSHHPSDDQFYRIIDVRNPAKPEEVGRWWLPGVRVGDSEKPPVRHKAMDKGFRVHNTNVYPQRPDRAYLGCIDGGAVILDISDKARPKMISRWDNSPPFFGFTHTVLPLFERGLLVVTEESVAEAAEDWPKLVWILDARAEENLVPISTCPLPPVEEFSKRGGRYGAHNVHENVPRDTSFQSEDVILGVFFNGGLRAYDIRNPFQPREIAHFVPPAPARSPKGAIQLNDVFADERGIVYAVDRHVGGLYVLERGF